jgi:hypothetical protein
VAGFDFEFSSTAAQETLQRSLLKWMQDAARRLGLRLHYRKVKGGFYVTLDGRLPEMEALSTYCYEGLDAIVATATAPPDRRARQRVLDRMLAAFEDRLTEMVESINEITDMMRDQGAMVVANSIAFDSGTKTHLDPTLRSFRHALIRAYGGIPARTLLEECHTVIEHLMAALLTPAERRNRSFEEQLTELDRRGIFDSDRNEEFLKRGGPLVAQLRDLKNRRRDAKHRGQGVDSDTVDNLTNATVVAVHLMLRAIHEQGPVTPGHAGAAQASAGPTPN